MKRFFTFSPKLILPVTLILTLFTFRLYSLPVKHSVGIVGFTYSPSSLTIHSGDTVEWTYSGSVSHNIDGLTTIYPSNPASFGNSLGTSWVYSFVFTLTGTYDYRCDLHYASGMTGQITVIPNTGITDIFPDDQPAVIVLPNPASKFTNLEISKDIDLSKSKISFTIYNTLGVEVMHIHEVISHVSKVNTESYPRGLYFYRVSDRSNIIKTGKLIFE
jgi:plastocyanin